MSQLRDSLEETGSLRCRDELRDPVETQIEACGVDLWIVGMLVQRSAAQIPELGQSPAEGSPPSFSRRLSLSRAVSSSRHSCPARRIAEGVAD
jgi:hypothetical protein